MPLLYRCSTPEMTEALGRQLGQYLKGGDIVLLFGDLGAGKTALVKGLGQGLGITAPMTSPTFAYVNRYPLTGDGEGFFYHYDLYRLDAGQDTASLGLQDSLNEPAAIHAIEWADRLMTLPDRFIRVEAEAKEGHHAFGVGWVGAPMPSVAVQTKALSDFATPLHVRAHMNKVAAVAQKMAQGYAEAGIFLNGDLLESAAALHDIARVCDFSVLDRKTAADWFWEEITDALWSKWQALRHEFSGLQHPDIACTYFKELGLDELGRLIAAHGSRTIVEEPKLLDSLEAKILYYADKRVAHDRIVSLKERFTEAEARYGSDNSPADAALYRQVAQKTEGLEKELFRPLAFGPEAIREL